MRAGILFAIIVSLASGVGFAGQPPIVQGGTYRTVVTSIVALRPCISIEGSGARIVLSENQLKDLSRNKGRTYQTEPERLARIAGDRAALLLGAVSSGQDASGCYVVSLDPTYPRSDAKYLVGQLIETGDAIIIRDGSNRPETSVVIHDFNAGLAGYRNFEFTGGGTFFSYLIWIS